MVPKKLDRSALKVALRDLVLLTFSAVLFALSHPNPLVVGGLGFLGFSALLPALWVLQRAKMAAAVAYGAYYGWLCYALFNYWLAAFNPVAWVIVPIVYLFYHLLLFPILSVALKLKKPWLFWLTAALWTAYEFLRTQGFLGYSYGIYGYTQYQFLAWIQSADLGGVWLTTWLTVLPSFAVVQLLRTERSQWPVKNLVVLGVLLSANLVYGLISPLETGSLPQWKVSLIQHDIDPWKSGLPEYRRAYERLSSLTRNALADDPEAIVWSETAFVPSIEYHRRYRENTETWRLVEDFLNFAAGLPVPLLLGNGNGTKQPGPNGWERRDTNSVLLYDRGELQGMYSKVRLVPFTEHFPYRDVLPWFYDFLKANDVHFWDAGKEWTVFDVGGVRVGTPICFEDTFGYIGRAFTLAGARVLINLTNDSWSKSRSSMRQHLAMAVFRSVENRRSLVRSTNGGWTAAISPNGRITAELEPMTSAWLTTQVALVPHQRFTLYSRWGDYVGWATLVLSIVFLLHLFLIRLTKGHGWSTM